MTPAARVSAAIEVLDRVLSGTPAEKALTNWARGSRYAGSGDRAAVRDHVFSALRRKRSSAFCGGAETGRGMMLALLRLQGSDPDTIYTNDRFAPPPLSDAERAEPAITDAPDPVRLDCPDWLWPEFQAQFEERAVPILSALQDRAPVFLRVNRQKGDLASATAALAQEGIEVHPHSLSATALQVVSNPRRVGQSAAYASGLVELQDAASQAVVDFLPLSPGQRVLDFCAGGGGKALAMAARTGEQVVAHDALPARMKALPERAKRAGAKVEIAASQDLAPGGFDLVLCDVPCSGSGAWRRSPEGKWALTRDRLTELTRMQLEILHSAKKLVAAQGTLAYVTCSLFSQENTDLLPEFCAQDPSWQVGTSRSLTPLEGGDGFFVALLTRANLKS